MPQPTRTVGPLHFEDLEPHRFEDLARQLIYDFRQWKSLEATGRTGSDEGMDIRAIEKVQTTNDVYEDVNEDDETIPIRDIEVEDRLWIIQCKRENRIGPSRLKTIVSTNLSNLTHKPYGYMIIAACDFSKAARDAFRDEAINQGAKEFYIWGKAEVEDQLFLPKNDHLLFAYFGISLQVRRKSIKSNLRARLTLKRKLTKELGDIDRSTMIHKDVLIRDPRNESYPYIKSPNVFIKSPLWRYYEFHAHEPPDHLAFVAEKYFAYVNWESKEFDILRDLDTSIPFYPELFGLEMDWWDTKKIYQRYNNYWLTNVPKNNRAWAVTIRVIHYDRIFAFDEIGDFYNPGPHLLVEFDINGNPFEPNLGAFFLKPAELYGPQPISVSDGKRISFFPAEIPYHTVKPQNDS